jgi:hypothetical protein
MDNQVARETDPARCRSLLKAEIDRARTQFAVSFQQLAQSFDDRPQKKGAFAPSFLRCSLLGANFLG